MALGVIIYLLTYWNQKRGKATATTSTKTRLFSVIVFSCNCGFCYRNFCKNNCVIKDTFMWIVLSIARVLAVRYICLINPASRPSFNKRYFLSSLDAILRESHLIKNFPGNTPDSKTCCCCTYGGPQNARV